MKELAISVGNEQLHLPSGIPSLSSNSTSDIITFIVSLIIGIGLILTLIYMMYAGIQWITSAGDKQKVEAAKGRIVYAIIGLIVIILALVIVSFVTSLFGINYGTTSQSQTVECPSGNFGVDGSCIR